MARRLPSQPCAALRQPGAPLRYPALACSYVLVVTPVHVLSLLLLCLSAMRRVCVFVCVAVELH